MYGYDYKQISKLPSDVDVRKYLEQVNKTEDENKNKINIPIEKKESDKKIIIDNKINKNIINEVDEEIYSEIYGINKGNIFERTSPTKPKDVQNKKPEEKKLEKKIQPKNISKSMKVMKKESTWAPTMKKKIGPIGKSLIETKKINKGNYGSNNPNKKVIVPKNKPVKK